MRRCIGWSDARLPKSQGGRAIGGSRRQQVEHGVDQHPVHHVAPEAVDVEHQVGEARAASMRVQEDERH